MRLALAYSSKDKVEQTEKTWARLVASTPASTNFIWCDASDAASDAEVYFVDASAFGNVFGSRVFGGADAAIAWKLTRAIQSRHDYTHIGLIENDVLLDPDWYEPTMALFEKGRREGLDVGAVSARSYCDRVLIQRDDYAVMNNIGAGFIIFTREAAEIVLKSFRTGWYPENRWLFAQVSGIDLSGHIGFREHLTTDWTWEAQLASHGLAALALTPSKAQMPWEDPAISTMLNLTTGPLVEERRDEAAFKKYVDTLRLLRQGIYKLDRPGIIRKIDNGMMFHAHQLGYLAGGPTWQGNLELKWSQGHGPFAYRAGPGGASLSLRLSGSCLYLVGGGPNGAQVSIKDTHSGFSFDPPLPASEAIIHLSVPGGPIPREIKLDMSEGGTFYAIQTTDPQMLDTTFRFSWDQLPEAK